MRTKFIGFILVLVVSLVACSQPSEPVAIKQESLVFTPADGAESVSVDSISVQFPAPLIGSAVSPDDLVVRVGGARLAGELNYTAANRTLTFVPAQPLEHARLHVVTVDAGIKFEGSRRMAGNASASFTTAPVPTPDPDPTEPEDEAPGDENPEDEEPGGDEPGDGEPGEGTPEDGEPGDDAPEDGEPGDSEPSDEDPDDGEPGDGEPDDGEPGGNDPGDGEPGDEDPDEEPTPVEFSIGESTAHYDGTPKSVSVTSTPPDVAFEVAYSQAGISVPEPVAAGTYDVSITATADGFQGTANGELTIMPRALTLTAEYALKSVGDADPPFTYQLDGSLVAGDQLTGNLSREPGEDPGTYAITLGDVDAGPNYALTFHGNSLDVSPFHPQLAADLAHTLAQVELGRELADLEPRYSRPGAWSFGSSDPFATEPDPATVAYDLAQLADALQVRADAVACLPYMTDEGAMIVMRVYTSATACGEPLPTGVQLGEGRFVSGSENTGYGPGGNQRYAVPFLIVAEGIHGDYTREVMIEGEIQFVMGSRSFARYALFTDVHEPKHSGTVWLMSSTLYDGPVHTNGNFKFAGRPWFGGLVTSAGATENNSQGAFGSGPGGSRTFFSAVNMMPNPGYPDLTVDGFVNRPEFEGGVDWWSHSIDLPTHAYDQRDAAEASGLYFDHDIEWMELFAMDSSGTPMEPGATARAEYQAIHVGFRSFSSPTLTTDLYRFNATGRLEVRASEDPEIWTVVTNSFNGVIYANGTIESLRGPGRTVDHLPETARPAIASFARLTVVARDDIHITQDLVYEDPPCTSSLGRNHHGQVQRAECVNLDAVNALGIFTPVGDIKIGNLQSRPQQDAPDDLQIHASLMASSGQVHYERFQSSGGPKGALTILGGIISAFYGPVGSNTNVTGALENGYERRVTFDPRFEYEQAPPYFPTADHRVTDTQTLSEPPNAEPWFRY